MGWSWTATPKSSGWLSSTTDCRVRVPHFQRQEGAFEAQQGRDQCKDDRCERAEITLVRVPDRLLLAHEGIRGFVRAAVVDLGYEVPETLPDDGEFYAGVRAARGESPYLDPALRVIAAKGGTHVGTQCPTRKWPLAVTCVAGHEFITDFDRLERDRWCPQCTHNAPKTGTNIEAVAKQRGYECLHSENRVGKDGRSRKYVTLQCPVPSHEPTEVLWDNFNNPEKGGHGCSKCGRASAGNSKRNSAAAIDKRLAAVEMTLVGTYETMTAAAVFECRSGHQYTSTLKKLEMSKADARCPVCTAESYEDVELLDEYTPETDSVRTKLTWKCRTCGEESISTWRGMRIRKYRCGNRRCPGR